MSGRGSPCANSRPRRANHASLYLFGSAGTCPQGRNMVRDFNGMGKIASRARTEGKGGVNGGYAGERHDRCAELPTRQTNTLALTYYRQRWDCPGSKYGRDFNGWARSPHACARRSRATTRIPNGRCPATAYRRERNMLALEGSDDRYLVENPRRQAMTEVYATIRSPRRTEGRAEGYTSRRQLTPMMLQEAIRSVSRSRYSAL